MDNVVPINASRGDGDYEFHPIANAFPLMDERELDDLVEKIKEANGVYVPIILYEGKILDGRNRYRACKLARIAPRYEFFTGTTEEAIQRAAAANLGRKHYTDDQLAASAAELANMKEGATPGNKRAAKTTSPNGPVVSSEETAPTLISQKKAADMLKVSHKKVKRVAAIKKTPDGEKLVKDIKEGKIKISQAEKQIKGKIKDTGRKAHENTGATQKITELFSDAKWRTVEEIADGIGATPEMTQAALDVMIWPSRQGVTVTEKHKEDGSFRSYPKELEIDVKSLPISAQEKIEIVLRQEKRKLQDEFEQRVRMEVKEALRERVLPQYEKEMEEARSIIKSRKGLMSREMYRLILGCLHPDRVSDFALKERYTKAFHEFKNLELQLCNEKEMPTNQAPIPRTWEELVAHREEMKAKRRKGKTATTE